MAPMELGDHTYRLLNGVRTEQKLREAALLEGYGALTNEEVSALLSIDPGESPETVIVALATIRVFVEHNGYPVVAIKAVR